MSPCRHRVLELLDEIQTRLGIALLFITPPE
jgi:ABC-type microcin C transport system duplicated ATPase subunit YejF